MRRASPLRSLTAVLLLVAVLWAATALNDSQRLPFALLVSLWFFVVLLGREVVPRSPERPDEQPLPLLARLAPRAPPAA